MTEAIAEILEIAKETPEGFGLEMGLYFGLFMAGIAVFNEPNEEDLLRRKLKADTSVSIYVDIARSPWRFWLMETACGSSPGTAGGSVGPTASIQSQVRLAASSNPNGHSSVRFTFLPFPIQL